VLAVHLAQALVFDLGIADEDEAQPRFSLGRVKASWVLLYGSMEAAALDWKPSSRLAGSFSITLPSPNTSSRIGFSCCQMMRGVLSMGSRLTSTSMRLERTLGDLSAGERAMGILFLCKKGPGCPDPKAPSPP
jgi:hypothetical protein